MESCIKILWKNVAQLQKMVFGGGLKRSYLEKTNENVNLYHTQCVSNGMARGTGSVAWLCFGNALSQSSASSQVFFISN